MTVTAGQIEQYLFEAAPAELRQSWDNVGLLVGDPAAPADKVLVALDITRDVVEEAVEEGCSLIVAHHPVMNCAWHPVQTVRPDSEQGWILTTLIQNRIAAICMHTNLDSAEGGVNDVLASALGLADIEPLGDDGIGRVGTLPKEMELSAFAAFVKERLGANGVRYAACGEKKGRAGVSKTDIPSTAKKNAPARMRGRRVCLSLRAAVINLCRSRGSSPRGPARP